MGLSEDLMMLFALTYKITEIYPEGMDPGSAGLAAFDLGLKVALRRPDIASRITQTIREELSGSEIFTSELEESVIKNLDIFLQKWER